MSQNGRCSTAGYPESQTLIILDAAAGLQPRHLSAVINSDHRATGLAADLPLPLRTGKTMFGNLIKIVLLAIIVASVTLFFRQQSQHPAGTVEKETTETATASEPPAMATAPAATPEPAPAEEPATPVADEQPQVEEPASSPTEGQDPTPPAAEEAAGESASFGAESAAPAALPPAHPGPNDTSPPSEPAPAPSMMQ